MTKIIVQHYVENLLKVLKVLKTRTALKRNGLSRIPLRSIRQGAKAPFKTKKQGRELQNYYNHQKSLKKLLTSDIIKSEKGGANHETVQIFSKSIFQKRHKRTKNVDRDNQRRKRKWTRSDSVLNLGCQK